MNMMQKFGACLGLFLLGLSFQSSARAETFPAINPAVLAYFANTTFSKKKILDLSRSTCGTREVAMDDPCGAAFFFCQLEIEDKIEDFLDANCTLDESYENWFYRCAHEQVDALQAMLNGLDSNPFLQKAKECAVPLYIYHGPMPNQDVYPSPMPDQDIDRGPTADHDELPGSSSAANGGGCSLGRPVGDRGSWLAGIGAMLGLFLLARPQRNR